MWSIEGPAGGAEEQRALLLQRMPRDLTPVKAWRAGQATERTAHAKAHAEAGWGLELC